MAKANPNKPEKCPNCGADQLRAGVCGACGVKGNPAAKKATTEKPESKKEAGPKENKSNAQS